VYLHDRTTGCLNPPRERSIAHIDGQLPEDLQSVDLRAGIPLALWPFLANFVRLKRASPKVFTILSTQQAGNKIKASLPQSQTIEERQPNLIIPAVLRVSSASRDALQAN
jgi:hypothetical protein